MLFGREVGVDVAYMWMNMVGIIYEMETWTETSTEGGNPSSMDYRCMLNHILIFDGKTRGKISLK